MSKRAERRAKKYGPDFMRNMHPFRFFTPVVVGTGKGGFNQFFFCLDHRWNLLFFNVVNLVTY